MTDPLDHWMHALEERHLSELRLAEVTRALRVLSSCYVERRSKLGRINILDGAGKRAAFALFYAPIHFLIVRHIIEAIGPASVRTILDLGCGTGPAGSAWSLVQKARGGTAPRVLGVDCNRWAVSEARWTYRVLEIRGRAMQRDLTLVSLPAERSAVVSAYAMNEVRDTVRSTMLKRYLEVAASGALVLIVEPIAQGVSPWWTEWRKAFEAAGGRAAEWRFDPDLPPLARRLAVATGLDVNQLKARSLWL
jgi:hypothetical protein